MLKVFFFASVREQLDVECITCSLERNIVTLISTLIDTHDEQWARVLRTPNIIVAVNHEIVTFDHVLQDGDEVAFFPPVTGG